jgi:hypothetical protein
VTLAFQAILAQSTGTGEQPMPHHPICCTGERLYLLEDGRLGCEHVEVPADDERTAACLNQSMAVLLIELLSQTGVRIAPRGS